jgi:hypothetical protein
MPYLRTYLTLLSVQYHILGTFEGARCSLLYNGPCCSVLHIRTRLLSGGMNMSGSPFDQNRKPKKLANDGSVELLQSGLLRKLALLDLHLEERKKSKSGQKNINEGLACCRKDGESLGFFTYLLKIGVPLFLRSSRFRLQMPARICCWQKLSLLMLPFAVSRISQPL